MQLNNIELKKFYKILTWLYRDSTNQLQSFARQTAKDFYSHGSLCKQDEIIVLNDALPQLVRRTC
jgi:archaellum component FlaD/FlaE